MPPHVGAPLFYCNTAFMQRYRLSNFVWTQHPARICVRSRVHIKLDTCQIAPSQKGVACSSQPLCEENVKDFRSCLSLRSRRSSLRAIKSVVNPKQVGHREGEHTEHPERICQQHDKQNQNPIYKNSIPFSLTMTIGLQVIAAPKKAEPRSC